MIGKSWKGGVLLLTTSTGTQCLLLPLSIVSFRKTWAFLRPYIQTCLISRMKERSLIQIVVSGTDITYIMQKIHWQPLRFIHNNLVRRLSLERITCTKISSKFSLSIEEWKIGELDVMKLSESSYLQNTRVSFMSRN